MYDAFGKLKRYITNDDIARYAYNSSGIRTMKSVDGITTKYILSGGDVIGEVSGGVTTTYLRGINLICTDEYYYVFDAHGDVVNLTDDEGSVVKSYDYDAFGIEKNPDDSDLNPFRYCGEYWDSETETYYLRARYYDPRLGRFTSEDPARDGLNWYTYCGNNPISRIDPSGENWKDVLGGLIESIDDNVLRGVALWLADIVNGDKELQLIDESEYDFYLGRTIGDAISLIWGAKETEIGFATIGNSIFTGGAVTVCSGGTLAIGGVTISVGGVAVGVVEVGHGIVVLQSSIKNYFSDLDSISEIKNNPYYIKGRPEGGNPKEDKLIRKEVKDIKSQDFIDFLKANGETTSKWKKYMETWETPEGIQYERHYWSNGVKSFYHD